ncbi:MAG: alkaline phosphatase family protein [Flammeovirgaceae bacterium]|nr:alkaline phosphatase family protein [Flammeovirgaceae bacterium]
MDELIDRKNPAVKVANGGTQAHVYVDDKHKLDSIYITLKSVEKNYTVLKREEYPERWHYKNDRVGDLMVIADEGYYIREGSRERF